MKRTRTNLWAEARRAPSGPRRSLPSVAKSNGVSSPAPPPHPGLPVTHQNRSASTFDQPLLPVAPRNDGVRRTPRSSTVPTRPKPPEAKLWIAMRGMSAGIGICSFPRLEFRFRDETNALARRPDLAARASRREWHRSRRRRRCRPRHRGRSTRVVAAASLPREVVAAKRPARREEISSGRGGDARVVAPRTSRATTGTRRCRAPMT